MKLRGRWRVFVLVLAIAAACILAACGDGGSEEPLPEPEEGVLTYAALNPLTSIQKRRFLNFNKNHKDVQIEVLDYSDEGGIDRLLTELAIGKVPDIMELHRLGSGKGLGSGEDITGYAMGDIKSSEGEYWMPYRQMARKGYLADLWLYIESDPELGREGLLEAPVKAAEVDGGLYMLFKEVSINTLIGEESVIGVRDGWTLDELMETFAAMPEGSTILRYNATRREMYSNLFCTTLNRYIDWETGECSFDNDEFRSMLEFLSTFPAEFETTLTPDEVEEELTWRRLTGEQMLESAFIYWLLDVPYQDTTFGGNRVTFVGYPTTDGSSGSFFNIHGTVLAMSSACRNKEAAWEFMRYLVQPCFTKKMHWDQSIKLPLNRKDFESGNTSDLRELKEDLPPRPTFRGGPKFEVYPPTKEDLQRFEKLINSTAQIYWPDNDLSEMVWEAIGPYFAGDKTLDETIQLVQNRVKLYVNENR